MKVVVLGLDALEYTLVEEWDNKSFKQSEYSKLILPIKKQEMPSTQIIWASFITGKNPEDHGIQSVGKWNNSIMERLSELYSRNCSRKGIIETLAKYFVKTMRKLGFKNRHHNKNDIKVETLSDSIKNSKLISIPSYNEEQDNMTIRANMKKAIENYDERNKLLKFSEDVFERRKKMFLQEMKNNYDFLMIHIFFLDTVQHICFNDKDKIRKYYDLVAEFVDEVKRNIDDDTLLLIVSDHGQINGIHTKYGFYSANKKLGLKNPKLIDFKNIIEKIVKNDYDFEKKENELLEEDVPENDKEKVMKHLKDLGYF